MKKNRDQKKRLSEALTGQVILDAMPQVAYVFNKEKKLVMWNKNTELVLGYSAEELYLKDVYDFVEKSTIEINSDAFIGVFSDKEEQIIEQNLVSKSGDKIPILDTANYALVGGEEYLIGLSIDITKLKDTEKKLKKVISELENLKDQLHVENKYLKEEYKGSYSYDTIIGESDSVAHSIHRLEQVAPTNTSVLLKGEIGTQRELFARVVHNKSERSDKPFIKADCSTSSSVLTESDLFGYDRGAYASALHNSIGKIEMAHKGTLFLYEIGELNLELQAKLYQVFIDGTLKRIGSSKIRKVDIRIIASSKHDLKELVSSGLFREDLFYMLNIYPIAIPPLRNRINDIPMLAKHYLQKYNQKIGKHVHRISKKALTEMQRYAWPGNLQELENIMERAVIISKGSMLTLEPFLESNEIDDSHNLLSLVEYEKRYIIKILEKTHWRVEGSKGAAQILEMNHETLRSRMRKLNIKRP